MQDCRQRPVLSKARLIKSKSFSLLAFFTSKNEEEEDEMIRTFYFVFRYTLVGRQDMIQLHGPTRMEMVKLTGKCDCHLLD